MDIPTVILDEIFVFLNITDYVCNVILVCKQWNDINLINKSRLIRKLIYNSCKHKLQYIESNGLESQCTVYDIIREYELSAAYTAIYDKHNMQNTPKSSDYFISIKLPTYPLYFDLPIDLRKTLSYKYLFHYIYVIHFGKYSETNCLNLCSLLLRLALSGGTLCVGFMLDLFFEKYLARNNLKSAQWLDFLLIFSSYVQLWPKFMKNKEMWVILQNLYHFVNTGDRSLNLWKSQYKPWIRWAENRMEYCSVLLNKKAHYFYYILKSLE